MTFSIAARCVVTGRFGIAISSSSPAVAARCAHLRAGVGAACSQNVTDPRLGERLLDELAAGRSAGEAMAAITAATPEIAWRQLTVVDRHGKVATHSGERALGIFTTASGTDCVAAGNLLATGRVPARMAEAFAASFGADLGDRLIGALKAGLAEGGEAGPVHSAGLAMVADVSWRVTDLRVDWSDQPIADLEKLWRLWRPQEASYVTRALSPDDAPGYGVPGDPTR